MRDSSRREQNSSAPPALTADAALNRPRIAKPSASSAASPRATSGYSWSNTGSGGPDAVYLIVNGDGTPDAPASCTFNGAPCHFSLSR